MTYTLQTLCKIPFASDEDLLEEHDLDIDDMFNNSVKDKAAKRILNSILPTSTGGQNHSTDSDVPANVERFLGTVSRELLETEFLSYPLSRIVVSLINEYSVIDQFARSEAKFSRYLLEQSERNGDELYSDDLSIKIVSDMFGLDIEEKVNVSSLITDTESEKYYQSLDKHEKSILHTEIFDSTVDGSNQSLQRFYRRTDHQSYYKVNVTDYIQMIERGDERFRLSNQIIMDGYCIISKDEIFDLFETFFYSEIIEDLPLTNISDDVAEEVNDVVEMVEDEIPQEMMVGEIDEVNEKLFPPVIDSIIERIQDGEDLMHEEWFTAASFLMNIGMDDEEILDIFEVHSDFFEDLARYQLEHIRSGGGEGDVYTPPTYETMRTWGFEWTSDELEQEVKHPLTYYRIKLDEDDSVDEEKESSDSAKD